MDVICIDHGSISEAELQVPSMGDLCRQAAQTLIWLGRGTRNTDLICKRLSTIDLINSKGGLHGKDIPNSPTD